MIAAHAPAQAPRWGRAVVFLVAVAAFVFAPVSLCPLRLLLRVPCPGCGGTRAVLLALAGHFGASMRMHPLAIVGALLMVPSLLFITRAIAHDRLGTPLPRALSRVWTIYFAALIVVWLARFAGAFGGPAPIG